VFFALVCLIGFVGIQRTKAQAASVLTINADGPLSGTVPAWVYKAAMQEPRSGLGVAAVNKKIYAIGGTSATGFSSTNEEYDPAANTWTFKTPMPTSRSVFGIAVCENKIYCIGGYTVGGPTGVNEVYEVVFASERVS